MKGCLKLKLIFTIALLILLPLLLFFPMNGNAVRASGNTLEDNFARPDQVGWGTTTNSSGVPNVAWGMDGSGRQPFVTISNQSGRYGYQGSINQIGIASDSAHLLRSVNVSMYDPSDQFMNDPTTQTILGQHGTPIIRMPFRDGWTSAQYLQALKAIKNAAAVPLVIVHGACVSDPYTPDNYWLSLVAQIFPTGRVYVEYGNEEDLGCSGGSPITATQYQASWNSVVSRLKTNHPTFQFVGPATYQANTTYIATFVNGANPQPDFISWHEYVCSTSDSNASCMSRITNWANHVNDTNTAVQKAIGHRIPIMITEWNLDPGSDQRYNNRTFIQQWTTTALNEWASLVNSGVYATYIYTTESHPSFQLIDSNDHVTYQGQGFFL